MGTPLLLLYVYITYSLLEIIMIPSLEWRNKLLIPLTWQILVLYIIFWVFKYYKYVIDLLTCFKMVDYKDFATPFHSGVNITKTCPKPTAKTTLYWKLVDKIIYLTHSRLNISFVVSVVSQFMQYPKEIH